ncbi:hypothetical protein LEY_31 [Paenibacillus phage Ley]|uniref:Uncharacterized protein n=3 Tax=Halcyonevirus C7Cdelta TaxID=2845733 RepID=A0A345ASI8_9CAUD|nr:hypothetical protein KMD17_gp31 [Paenibacillus phage C7Cdelta]AXF39792.1 hypothetical protein C7CDELTA_31 [Paenibacillus phage C7Cdelta]AXF39958.1 hypothetical protein ASH_31 [Paenibacillus phage Ash]AXF40245.1 hypothetical protein LEY_31 [Paenibacillus phage Ley]
MGCDIHLFVEKKVNGAWEALKGINEPMIQHIQSMLQSFKDRGEDTSGLEHWLKEEQEGTYDFVDIQRNYRLYAALADVRNSYGIEPIHGPRGLPSGVSAVVKEQADNWGEDGHDHSYLTIKELSEFDWNQEIAQARWETPYNFIQWTEPLKDRVDTFYTWSIPKLIELADGDLESVRIVFWFDN